MVLLLLLTTSVNAKESQPVTHYHIDGKEVSAKEYAALRAQLTLQEPPGCKRKAGGGTVFWRAQDTNGQRYRVEITTNRNVKDERIQRDL